MTLEYPTDLTINGVSFATLAQKVQANLRGAGFDVALAGSPVATFQPKFRAGHVAFGLWLWMPAYPDPAEASNTSLRLELLSYDARASRERACPAANRPQRHGGAGDAVWFRQTAEGGLR